ncbi:X-linked retinitis pigmentosa GTPase regulator-interacting protein 1-like [Girardinichthys multiradiatus]|uniref:X-linked retinitis pigmentosa GTPase regulator-interacting protein 1-like n=1 Tax=Girardinichthys multiradiatus TaxID=208333 RepID=UPI001FAD1D08|nr:X-linked retinitis pigmentosa GTPase regulator-interacting protein 1-like [Girardinichthys multiradiatus]
MTIQEVNEARKNSGPDASGCVINIAGPKTNKAFGYAQIYLDSTEFSWLERWIELQAQLNPKSNLVFISGSKTPAKNMVKYLQLVWTEMGLPGRPTFTAVATHANNFHCPEIRSRLSAVMFHDTATADKFYVSHLNMEQSLEVRRLFEEDTHGASAPGPSSTSLPEPRVPARPTSDKRKRHVSVSESTSSEEKAEVPYQESGSSALEEEMEEINRAKRRLAKKRGGDGKEEEDDEDDEQEQGEKDQQEEDEEDQQQQEEEQQEEDLKVRDFL